MIHSFIGNLGHLFVIVALITSLVATIAYFKASNTTGTEEEGWKQYARIFFYIHAVAVVGVVYSLFHIIYNNYYEYHYAWSVSSKTLPLHYMISSFWQNQEGSFLLWIFWEAVLGIIIINTNKYWEAPVMTVFSLVQAFLASMIVGVVIPGINLKIGSDPFILLRDAFPNDEFLKINPDFIPPDGRGMNPLLQNYWMVIHPPTLFLGFATTLVPFAYCIAGLWKKRFKEWIRPALPWALFSAMVLGVGILMGGYWAYETLTFGGYWNWDPVENAVYVPWLVLVASYHTMITYKNSNTALKTSIILVIATFILILYSTFLTRSGILGNSSVHSFVDLGLSGQLLLYLMAFMAISVFLSARVWRQIPSSQKEIATYSREFWIFMGATTLCLMGFQVIVPTSFPVYNSIIEWFGGTSNIALPSDQVSFYTQWQLWFAAILAILSGTGQFFWWKKMDKKDLINAITYPILLTLIVAGIILVVAGISDIGYIVLLTTSIYAVISNGKILLRLFKSNIKLSGGAVTHIGMALMLIGILFSSGYSKVVSLNTSGIRIFKDAEDEFNLENVLLFINEPRAMDKYNLNYKGRRVEVKGLSKYVNYHDLGPAEDETKAIAKKDIIIDGRKYADKGDTLDIYHENIYFEIDFTSNSGQKFTLYPRVQLNPTMGNVGSPDIKRSIQSDLYTHLSYAPYLSPDEEVEWSEPEDHEVKLGEQFFINDYVTIVEKVERVNATDLGLNDSDIAIKAIIKVFGEAGEYIVEPLYLIRDRMVARIPEAVEDLGIKITFLNIHPETNSFTIQTSTTQKDYVVLKALEKPMINVLWIGTLILVFGFFIAIYRRYTEFIKMRDKGRE
ncbi:cytochrome c biogenesis protein CcsA [Fulvivirgaceae bacterium BMA10]|uniref:Cytochrome c biogenesis protein CcsA n=1 Tax=Splendidivirga corallicola TaxID=3051826 RepID=A0ABT8KLQ5_9BACT|nr:cytochrome c biogenesis protein CcsA [Fulvivirgaceae bacterium BMA10]